MGVTLMTFFTF